MLCECFPQSEGGICLAGELAAHRICLQWVLKHGIVANGMANRMRLRVACCDGGKYQGQWEPWAGDHQLPRQGRIIRVTLHREGLFELGLEG